MALVLPFRGIGYNLKKVDDLSKVVAPPYDVISPVQQDALYEKHPHNVVRLTLNKETAQDRPQDNRYSRSKGFYQSWLKEGILVRALKPTYYFLREEFGLPAEGRASLTKQVRQGFIGIVKLEDYERRIILPHEKTQNKPKADRLALMEACEANFSPIFSMFTDPEQSMKAIYEKVFAGPHTFDLIGPDGYRHTLWMVDDPQVLRRTTEVLAHKQIYIADGHHRYETCLAYRAGQMARFPANKGTEPYHFIMMYLAAMEDEGLVILPTHRVVAQLEGFNASSFLQMIGQTFTVETFSFSNDTERAARDRLLKALAQAAAKSRSLGMLLAGLSSYFLLSLKNEAVFEEVIPNMPPSLKALDVNILHVPIFQKLLRIGPAELAAGKNVTYFKDPGEAAEMVLSGKGQGAFFLNPTTVYQVRDVALAGETMPSKSTFFYPKILDGLVMHPLDPHEEIPLG